jgi:aminoglycoside phosphotransferase (APT) family kinase protein
VIAGRTPGPSAAPRAPLDAGEIDATVLTTGHALGLDARDRTLIKFTNNAVLYLPRAQAVIRIAGSATVGQRASRVVHVAKLLSQHHVPVVKLKSAIDYLLIVRGHEVTVWDAVTSVRTPVPEDLAALLTAMHAAPVDETDLSDWNPVAGVRQRIGSAYGAPADVLSFLIDECDATAAELANLAAFDPLLPRGIIHGDAFLGNIIVGPAGPVLCDFDSTCWGPREWDLTPIAVGALRFNYGVDLQRRFVRAYGVDVTGWKGFAALRRLRELQLVTSVLPVLATNPGLRPQWQFRVESLRRGDEDARWSPYSFARS